MNRLFSPMACLYRGVVTLGQAPSSRGANRPGAGLLHGAGGARFTAGVAALGMAWLLAVGGPAEVQAQTASKAPARAAPAAPAAAAPASDPIEVGVAALQRGHYATAMRAWLGEAQKGNALAQTNVGYLHEHGLGVAQSYVEAMGWYRKAAAQNLPQAQFNIGTLYFYGYGVERNPREALNWFRQAARQNLAEAQYMVGQAYQEGVGTPADAAVALDWYVKSAVQGYAPAQLMAAMVYLSGDAGRADAAKAHVWADVALTNGRTDASLVRDYASYKLSRREIERAREAAQTCLKSGYKDCPPR